jgi:hypothetical protein
MYICLYTTIPISREKVASRFRLYKYFYLCFFNDNLIKMYTLRVIEKKNGASR